VSENRQWVRVLRRKDQVSRRDTCNIYGAIPRRNTYFTSISVRLEGIPAG